MLEKLCFWARLYFATAGSGVAKCCFAENCLKLHGRWGEASHKNELTAAQNGPTIM